jgi:DNA-binding CsgD family transcriptional regulator
MIPDSLATHPLLSDMVHSSSGIRNILCTVIDDIAEEKCQLLLHPPYREPQAFSFSLPIINRNYRYGTVCWSSKIPHDLDLMQSIADMCGEYLVYLEDNIVARWCMINGYPHMRLDITPRERAILIAMYERLTTREIAELFTISKRTVETHQAKIYKKLSVKRASDAIYQAMNAGLFRYLQDATA